MKKGRDSSFGRVSVKKGRDSSVVALVKVGRDNSVVASVKVERDSSVSVALTGIFFFPPRVRFRNTPLRCCYRPGVLSHAQTSIVSSTHKNTAHTGRSEWRLQGKATRISCKR